MSRKRNPHPTETVTLAQAAHACSEAIEPITALLLLLRQIVEYAGDSSTPEPFFRKTLLAQIAPAVDRCADVVFGAAGDTP